MNHDIPNIPDVDVDQFVQDAEMYRQNAITLQRVNRELHTKINYLEDQLQKVRIERDLLLRIVEGRR
jgi:endonuclease III-like uncharacterized protein